MRLPPNILLLHGLVLKVTTYLTSRTCKSEQGESRIDSTDKLLFLPCTVTFVKFDY